MVVRRDSLRAQTDFFSPMTGNTSPRFAGSPRGKYSDEVKSRMAGMGEVRSTRTNPIEAAFVELIKTEDPFTEIDTKKSYAPEEEEGLIEALGGIGDGTSDVGERVEEFLAPVTGGGGGNKPNVISRNPNDKIASMSTQQLVDRDNRMYGNTFPSGSMGSGSKSTIESSPGSKVDTNIGRHKEGRPEDQPPTKLFVKPKPEVETPKPNLMGGQGGLPLGTTTQRQGGTVKDGVKVEKSDSPAVNASSFLQKNVRGSTSFGGTGKDESARPTVPKQTVASLPSDYKKKEEAARAVASAYKASKADSQAKGDAAAKATGIPSKPPAGSFGISDKGKAQAAVNKAQAQKKSSPSTSKSSPSTSKSSPSSSSKSSTSSSKSSTSTSKSQGRGGSRGGSSGGSGSSSKGGSSGGSKSGGSTGRGGSRGGSSGGSGSSSKGGTGSGGTKTSRSASAASKRRTGRSKTRCDIRTKVDISVLTNMDLLKDDLANVAYFVKDLQETN